MLSNMYGAEVVTNALAEPAPPLDGKPDAPSKKRPPGRPPVMSREQAEQVAKNLAEYDKSVSRR